MDEGRVFSATVTRQGRVRAPAEPRRELVIDGGGRVRFVDDTGIRFEAAPSVADLFGALPALPGASDDFAREIDEAISAALAENDGWNPGR